MVEALEAAQRRHGGRIPASEFASIAAELGVPIHRLFGVATFFPHFRLTAAPAIDVRVCTDMSCMLRGGARVHESFAQVAASHAPGKVAVAPVSCLGRCDGAPAVSVNDVPYWGIEDGVQRALAAVEMGGALPAPAAPPRIALRSDPGTPYAALRRLLATRDVDGVIAQLNDAGLRGMGGAGFPTARKWEAVRREAGDEKYVVCNADESEPGTIKDRAILDSAPHLVVEGMAIACVVTGARRGILYIRHEYEPERESVAHAIDEARSAGLIGPDAPCDLDVFVSPGGYICGEESALLEAIEGRRAQPRLKPPFPVQRGLWGKPTVINNVETLAAVPAILHHGAAWWQAQGTNGCAGLKVVGVSGDVRRPGVFQVAMGTSLRQVIEGHAGGIADGRQLKAVAPSGASSGFLPASLADVPLDFAALQKAGSMLGSGAIVAVADGTCMVDLALNVARFFARESCGKCWPCRVGSEKIVAMLERATRGDAGAEALAPLDELSQTLQLTSICGLGQVVPSPIGSVVRHFPDEVRAHLDGRCPAGTCRMPR